MLELLPFDFTKSLPESKFLRKFISHLILEHLHNPLIILSQLYSLYSSWLVLQTFLGTPCLPFKLTISEGWCFLLNDAYSLLFLALAYLHSYLLASVYHHSIFFFKDFYQASALFSLLNCSLFTSTTTKALDSLWSSCFVKVNFNFKHICILNPQTENLWVNSRHVLITMVFLLALFKMHFPHNAYSPHKNPTGVINIVFN